MYGYEAVNVEVQMRDNSSLLHWTRRMLAVRKTSSAFGRGKKTFLRPGTRKILVYLSEYGDDVLLTVFNLSRAAQPVELDLSAFKGRVPVEMLGRTTFPPIGELPYLLTLASYGFYWFKLTTDAPVPGWHQGGVALEDRPTLVLFDGWTSLFRDRVMPWRIAMAERTRGQVETEVLPRHIENQRWYAAKSEKITRTDIADHAVWTQGTRQWLLPLLDVRTAPGDAKYFMPLAIAWEDHEEERMKQLQPAAIAKVRQQAQVGVMADAFFDDAFCRAMVVAMVQQQVLPTEGGEIRFTCTQALANVQPAAIEALEVGKPSMASSNTAVVLGDQLFLKCYRQVREGVNPELELGRFLTDTVRFANCVPVAGAVEYHRNDGSVATLALLQAYVPNQGDAWDYTLSYLERVLGDVQGAADDAAPTDHGAFLILMRLLGQRTAEMHLAFTSAPAQDVAFAPEALTDEDQSALRDGARESLRETLALVQQRLDTLPEAARADAGQWLQQAQGLDARIGQLAAGSGGQRKIRLHGDYHLGQVLVSRNDFIIIDFEGEPARPMDERRRKASPLRDVAGMLRSFNYARWSALRRVAQNAQELDKLGRAAVEWESQVRTAFMGGYSQTLAMAGEPGVDEALLSLFEIDKALYELRYELNNRIDWVQVPLQGLMALGQTGSASATQGGEA
ncbi:MAG: alpha-amylase, partial [Comamonadaceae bacterium]